MFSFILGAEENFGGNSRIIEGQRIIQGVAQSSRDFRKHRESIEEVSRVKFIDEKL